MQTRPQQAPALPRALIMAVGVALMAVATAGTASAQAPESAAPQLSIAVDNGRTTTASGDTLDYTVTVRNLGTTQVNDLVVTQSAPAGHQLTAENAEPTAGTGDLSWSVDLTATGEVVLRSEMEVSDTPPELLRLATVACARMTADGPPIVCASHSDQLPAGAGQEAALLAADSATWWDGPTRWYALGGGVLLVAGLVTLVTRRRTVKPEARRDEMASPRGYGGGGA